MSLYDEALDSALEVEGLEVRHKFQDDPCTIEFNELPNLSNPIAADEDGIKHYPRAGYKTGNIVIPFKSVGQMTCKLLAGSRLYGTLRDDLPISYNIGNGVFERCPKKYFLCYLPHELRPTEPAEFIQSILSPQTTGYGELPTLTDTGREVVNALALAAVGADEVIKGFKLINVAIYGKLIKSFTGGWKIDDLPIDVSRVLRENPQTSE